MAFTQEFITQLGSRVEALEACSGAELVVVLAPSSDSYAELDHQNGFVVCVLLLFFMIHSPLEFHSDLVVLYLVVTYALTVLISRHWTALKRRMVRPARRRTVVQNAARAAFVSRGVAATRDRTGILLYLSELELRACFVPDLGVSARLGAAQFNELEHRWAGSGSLAAFESVVLEGLTGLEQPLAQALPRADDDVDELPNQIVQVGRPG